MFINMAVIVSVVFVWFFLTGWAEEDIRVQRCLDVIGVVACFVTVAWLLGIVL
jgi:hypothetical protein